MHSLAGNHFCDNCFQKSNFYQKPCFEFNNKISAVLNESLFWMAADRDFRFFYTNGDSIVLSKDVQTHYKDVSEKLRELRELLCDGYNLTCLK
jgi:hypothetical protein